MKGVKLVEQLGTEEREGENKHGRIVDVFVYSEIVN